MQKRVYGQSAEGVNQVECEEGGWTSLGLSRCGSPLIYLLLRSTVLLQHPEVHSNAPFLSLSPPHEYAGAACIGCERSIIPQRPLWRQQAVVHSLHGCFGAIVHPLRSPLAGKGGRELSLRGIMTPRTPVDGIFLWNKGGA